jgi:hypothetical protein
MFFILAILLFSSVNFCFESTSIVKLIPMHEHLQKNNAQVDYSSDVYFAECVDGKRGVFKVQHDTEGEMFAEVAAYRASEWLGLHMVPPTIITRDAHGRWGSLQDYIEPAFDWIKIGKTKCIEELVDQSEVDAMRLFYFVFGQWDIGASNQIIYTKEGKNHIALIDNGVLYDEQQIQYSDFAFIHYGAPYREPVNYLSKTPFPFDKVQQGIPNEQLKEWLCYFGIPEETAFAMINRAERNNTNIRYVIWNNAFWIQYYKYYLRVKANYVEHPNPELIEKFKKLTKQDLCSFWAEGLKDNYDYVMRLIDLTLERRDQLCNAHVS